MTASGMLRAGYGINPHIYKEGGWWFIAYRGRALPMLGRDSAMCCAAWLRSE